MYLLNLYSCSLVTMKKRFDQQKLFTLLSTLYLLMTWPHKGNLLCSCPMAFEPSTPECNGKAIKIWCKNLYKPYIKNVFVPVERITGRAYEPIDREEALVIPMV